MSIFASLVLSAGALASMEPYQTSLVEIRVDTRTCTDGPCGWAYREVTGETRCMDGQYREVCHADELDLGDLLTTWSVGNADWVLDGILAGELYAEVVILRDFGMLQVVGVYDADRVHRFE